MPDQGDPSPKFEVGPTLLDKAHALLEQPKQIGPYHILGLISDAGGMGTVYKAEQRTPIQRAVAVKVIKLGMDTKEVIARFDSERQALARMDHPHIARVLDAGATDTGRPFFVMDFVPGQPITKFCDEEKLSIRDRLELFCQVCDAINHAHTKAILHRDIKSSNVLAYLHDGKPCVKVIDFGIAKALTANRLTAETFYTEQGRIIGTYESMSPEQASGSQDIDTRTDVYSLGVLLYELLTGAKPFDRATLACATEDELRRIIREVEPPRPSTRLTSLGETAMRVAELRREQLDHLAKELRSELEWIPLKAMRKERDRRYASAALLAQDVRNYLDHQPLIAGPESRLYQVRKYYQRNQRSVIVTAGLVLLAVAAAVIYVRENRAKQRILSERNDTSKQLIVALTKLIDESNLRAVQSRDVGSLGQSEAKLRDAVAQSLQVLGPDDPLTLTVQHNLALVLHEQGKLDEAKALYRDVLAARRRTLGDSDPETLLAVQLLGGLLLAQERFAEAEPFVTESLDRCRQLLGSDHPMTLTAMNNMATLLHAHRKTAQAQDLMRETLARRRRVLGDDDRDTLATMNNLGAMLRTNPSSHAEAEHLLTEASDSLQKLLGEYHPETLASLHELGALRRDQRRTAEAEQIFRKSLDGRIRALGPGNPLTLMSRDALGRLLKANSRFNEAEVVYRELYEQLDGTQTLPWVAAIYVARYGVLLVTLERYWDADRALREAYQRLKDTGQVQRTEMRDVVAALATVCENTGRADEAARWRGELASLSAATGPAGTSPATTTPAAAGR